MDLISRTAVYVIGRTVVWEVGRREAPPYPDSEAGASSLIQLSNSEERYTDKLCFDC